MIKIEHITKKFKDKMALDDISFDFPDVGFVIIRGHNGSGKSTLMNILGAIDKPDAGSIEIDGQDITKLSAKELSDYREKYVDFIFQDGNTIENMTALENIEIVGSTDRLNAVAKFLDIESLLNKKAKELSGGESQRVGIARALMKNSKILLADEPTSALDAKTREKIFKLLDRLSETRLVIMITHDTNFIEKYADVILTLDEGHLIDVETANVKKLENELKPYKNSFSPFKFARKNSFVNKKKMLRSSITLILTFFLIIISATLGSLDIDNMHYDTLVLENQNIIEIRSCMREDKFNAYSGYYTKDNLDYVLDRLGPGYTYKTPKSYVDYSREPNMFYSMLNTNNETSDLYNIVSLDMAFKDADELTKVDYGRKPNAPDEIVISSYLAESIIKKGVLSTDKYYQPKSIEELITSDRTFPLSSNIVVKIVGIFDVEMPLGSEELKSIPREYLNDEINEYITMQNVFIYDLYYRGAMDVYTSKDFKTSLDKYIDDYSFYLQKDETYRPSIEIMREPMTLLTGDTVETLGYGEVIINSEMMAALGLTQDNYMDTKVDFTIKKYPNHEETLTVTIKGVADGDYIYMSEETLKSYLADYQEIYSTILIKEKDTKKLKQITDEFRLKEGLYRLKSPYSDAYITIEKSAKIASIIFTVITGIFGLLGFFFLLSYIKGSITLHKKDIATLKCLGIKDFDILKIFAIEASTLSVVSYMVTLVLFTITRMIANAVLSDKIGFKINILPFDIWLFLIIILIIISISFIISLLSFKKISKTSPKIIFNTESL